MLTVKKVSAGYSGKRVLFDITFNLDFGQCLSIIGPNGCGKTTLLKCIANLIDFDGEISLDGENLAKIKRRKLARKVAVLSQKNEMYFPYSVYDTVMLGRFSHIKPGLFAGEPTKKDIAAVNESIEAVGLSCLIDRQINTLSGGQLQRVFLARVLAQNPQIILLDEPTNHLDLKHQLELVDYIKKWVGEGKEKRAVIGVFHDINIALRLTENVLFMDSGKLSRMGNFRDTADDEFLQNLFGVNVVSYMTENSRFWESMKNGRHLL
ncbi:MAG: ABC transporter ATP-binding protein [Ruminococcus sp.]|jgi:iron complex transport system ATP-binding protein|nr:ABC transporter ATP-binding protein [Ruminococcus sp.]